MKTQNQCYCAIADAYRDLVGRAFTMEEVAEWALGRHLMPTPKRGAPQLAFDDFERRLQLAKDKGLLPDVHSPKRLQAAEFAKHVS